MNVCTGDDKTAEFGAGVSVVAVKNIGADFHLQILGHIPDRPGLPNSGGIVHMVAAVKKNLFKQNLALNIVWFLTNKLQNDGHSRAGGSPVQGCLDSRPHRHGDRLCAGVTDRCN